MKTISNGFGFYPAGTHDIKVHNETGSHYWAVKTKNLMFTYFEVEPQCKFAEHTHESEQITYVLEGTLYFEIDNQIFAVGKGDLISISSLTPHTVWTGSDGAKAVDTWSPVNNTY